jgi:hypothetical protein
MFKAAVYDGHPGTEEFNQTGLRIRLSDAEGLFTIGEVGWTWGTGRSREAAFITPPEPDSRRIRRRRAEDGDGLDVFVARRLFRPKPAASCSSGSMGASTHGTDPGRPDDVLGLGAIHARLRHGHETVFELTYKIVSRAGGASSPTCNT